MTELRASKGARGRRSDARPPRGAGLRRSSSARPTSTGRALLSRPDCTRVVTSVQGAGSAYQERVGVVIARTFDNLWGASPSNSCASCHPDASASRSSIARLPYESRDKRSLARTRQAFQHACHLRHGASSVSSLRCSTASLLAQLPHSTSLPQLRPRARATRPRGKCFPYSTVGAWIGVRKYGWPFLPRGRRPARMLTCAKRGDARRVRCRHDEKKLPARASPAESNVLRQRQRRERPWHGRTCSD